MSSVPCGTAYTSVSTYRRTSTYSSSTRVAGIEHSTDGQRAGRWRGRGGPPPAPPPSPHIHTHAHGQRTKTEWYNMGTVLLHTVLHKHYNIPFHRRKILIEINETIAMGSKKCSDFYLFNFVSTRFKNHLPYNLKFIKIMEIEQKVRSASNKQHFSKTDNVYTIRHLSWIN